MTRRLSAIFLILSVLLIIAFMLPWVVNSSAALTFNLYDLAEWTNLHPAVQSANPPLMTTLLLRLPWLCTAVIFSFSAVHMRWLYALGVILIAAALLPPVEFLRFSDNINYRQQFTLAISVLVIGLVGVSGILARFAVWIIAAASVTGGLVTILGTAQALSLLQGFGLQTTAGFGAVSTLVLFAATFIAGTVNKIGQHSYPILPDPHSKFEA